MAEKNNPALGGDALEFLDSLLTPEEIAESNRRVAEIGKEIEARKGYEIDFRRLRDDLQAVARLLEEGGLIDHLDRYDYQRVKALAACYELWDFVSDCIIENDEFWEQACSEVCEEALRLLAEREAE